MLTMLKTKKTKAKTKTNSRETKGKYEVTCPGCNISYDSNHLNDNPIQCMDCGYVYMQKTHSNNVIDWIREKIITVGGC